jgi:penicillin-binding protein 1B
MAGKQGNRRAKRARRSRGHLRWLGGAALVGLVLVGAYAVWLDRTIVSRFEGKRWSLPARIHARPLELYPGKAIGPAELIRELQLLGYRKAAETARPGTFLQQGKTFQIHTRPFRFWDGEEPARVLRLGLGGGGAELSGEDGRALPLVRLDPAVIGRIYPQHNEDRVLVRLRDVPKLLIDALLAVEDRGFYRHFGVDPLAIARALWANLRSGRTVQGGSTITQQLVKNYFLSDERTLVRKVNEAMMAVLLERHYSKDEILEAYLNEIYLGQQGQYAIHGLGQAAYFYFGRPLEDLDLAEIALLVGLARGASYYNPRRHEQRALARRGLVIDALLERGLVSEAEARKARAAPLGLVPDPPKSASIYPAFLDLTRRLLQRDYREEDLRTEGLQVFTTLDPQVQEAAEEVLVKGLVKLERQRGQKAGALEGAVVVTDPTTGEVLALVGGRDVRGAGFNRALDAVRLIGSLMKPVVYLAALTPGGGHTAASVLDDSPITLQQAGSAAWRPENYDRQSHGPVPLHEALARSYNLATVRLGLEVGMRRVVTTLERLGVSREVPAFPSLFLGAAALTPLEVTQAYQTLAANGFRMPLRAVREVTAPDGRPLARYRLDVEQAFPAGPVFILNTLLQEAFREGTGRSAYQRLPGRPALAGKTGTTDDLRDSWFAGFGRDRLAVVWVGRDDNKPAGFSGAQGALQIWADLMARLGPAPWSAAKPADVGWQWVDRASGRATDPQCPGAERLPFLVGTEPAHVPCGGGEAEVW